MKYYFNGALDKIGRIVFPRYKRNLVILFRYTSALGDALMLSTLASEVKKRNPKAIVHVITGLPQLFDRNPDVDLVTKDPGKSIPGLGKYLIRYENHAPWKHHLLKYCCQCIDITGNIELKTYIYPTEDDYTWATSLLTKTPGKVILVNRKAGPRTDKKNWPDEYWDLLIPMLCTLAPVIEIGTHSNYTPYFKESNYLNLVGKTTIHQTSALMSKAGLLICPVTGLLHLASAFDLPTLCILGGSEPAIGTQYKNTHYLENRPSCADCYEKGPCMNNFVCLNEIKPDDVLSRAKSIIGH